MRRSWIVAGPEAAWARGRLGDATEGDAIAAGAAAATTASAARSLVRFSDMLSSSWIGAVTQPLQTAWRAIPSLTVGPAAPDERRCHPGGADRA